MAEQKDDKDNPFSFKSFVSSKDRKTPTTVPTPSSTITKSDIDVDDIFESDLHSHLASDSEKLNLPGNFDEKAKENKSQGLGSSKGAGKKPKSKENPFSFKKFLSGSGGSNGASNDRPAASTLPNTISAIGLEGLQSSTSPSDLPGLKRDFSIPSGSDTTSLDLLEPGLNATGWSKPQAQSKDHDIFADSDDESGFSEHFLPSRDSAASGPSIPSALPDFLSDGAALSASSIGYSSPMTNSTHEDLLSQIQKLQEENSRLRKDLAIEKQRCSDKNQRLSQLQIDLERQKKKEVEETKVMEQAVLQVEENLVSTTQRAVQAEETAVKLKKEVKTLQGQVKLLTAENQAYRSGDGGLSDIRERTKYTAEQLISASAIAEKNIKELSAGVDQLRLLSQVLSSLEKVTEVKPETLDAAANKESKV